MMIRKWTKGSETGDGERVETAAKSVGLYDDEGNKNKILAGVKYIVSGDTESYFVKPPKKKEVKDDETIRT